MSTDSTDFLCDANNKRHGDSKGSTSLVCFLNQHNGVLHRKSCKDWAVFTECCGYNISRITYAIKESRFYDETLF